MSNKFTHNVDIKNTYKGKDTNINDDTTNIKMKRKLKHLREIKPYMKVK